MKVSVDYTKYLNTGQVAVGVSDLPLYALWRSIQMAYPEEFEGYFCFMGSLLIEQAALVCIGHLTKGSGLVDIVLMLHNWTQSALKSLCAMWTISKKPDTHFKWLQQLSQKKLNGTFKTRTFETVELWTENQKVNPVFDYWFNVLRNIKIVFLIFRSFTEANIDLLVASLELMVLLFFSLDYVHYSRWVSVFILELKHLPVNLSSCMMNSRKVIL